MENRWIDVKFPPKNMREVWIRTANGSSLLGHYNYSKKVWYDHASYNPVTATGWQEVEPAGREEYALLEAENAQLKEAIAVYQRNEKFDIRDIRQLKRTLWLTRAERAKAIKWHEGLERYLQSRKKWWPSRFSFMSDDEMYHEWYKCWCEVERKCQAKAEEYK